MNKQELKKILKPLIKECIKEVIFEDGTLSTIISEVVKGTTTTQVIQEVNQPKVPEIDKKAVERKRKQLLEQKRKMLDAIGKDADHIYNVDPVSIWLLSPKSLAPGLPAITKMVGEEYMKARPDTKVKSAHVGMAASNSYVFFTDVLPRAIKKYGGIDAESLRKASLDTKYSNAPSC